MTDRATILQLQIMVCERDVTISKLKIELLAEQLRVALGASPEAVLDPRTLTFTEPPAAPEP